MNKPVLLDWLSVLLAPVIIIGAALALFARRSASKAGEPMPGWGMVAQWVAAITAMFLGLLHILWGQ